MTPLDAAMRQYAEQRLRLLAQSRPPLAPEDEARIVTQATSRLPEELLEAAQDDQLSPKLLQCIDNRLAHLLEVQYLTPAYYQQLRQRLLCKAFQYRRDWNIADDLVQETYEHMIRKQDQFRGDSSYSTWIHSILFHRLMSDRRPREVPVDPVPHRNDTSTHDSFTLLQLLESGQYDAPTAEEEILAAREKLSKVLALIPVILTDRYSCQAINLLFVQQRDHQETARLLGIRVDHLYKIVSTARQRLLHSSRIRAILEG